ncbi:rRNA maturation RNase YbeY [Caloramator sp. E03]|uniref:rRNA maturation RNase YbeY n=1 Tax=Caloramator sp. E03 TaxID=2576307 RepID=UPI001110A325|nr:rRNA maturation RNase YbeY [Caloramator sp. E03]QCX32404.1 rRNA maturation RNase YbeY [Caloramator sp. E03]
MIEFDNRQNKIEFTQEIQDIIEKSIYSTLQHENFSKPYEISVVLTDNDKIKEINKEFRGIDRETDVLSFPMLNEKFIDNNFNFEDINPQTGEVVLGDIVLSLEKAKSQAIEYGHSFEREVSFLTVHSVLHLLGYDHERDEDRIIMRQKEESILEKIGLVR